MKNKIIKSLAIGLIAVFSNITNIANASLIDNGSFTTANGLDWLDWDLTLDMTQTEALTANTGWRVATDNELKELFSAIVGRPIAYDVQGICLGCLTPAEVQTWFGFLGATQGVNVSAVSIEGLGFYGTYYGGIYAGFDPGNYGQTNRKDAWLGTALVRATGTSPAPVPEPSVLAMFALGLLGFGARKIKQK